MHVLFLFLVIFHFAISISSFENDDEYTKSSFYAHSAPPFPHSISIAVLACGEGIKMFHQYNFAFDAASKSLYLVVSFILIKKREKKERSKIIYERSAKMTDWLACHGRLCAVKTSLMHSPAL